jgi:hypothetical protein
MTHTVNKIDFSRRNFLILTGAAGAFSLVPCKDVVSKTKSALTWPPHVEDFPALTLDKRNRLWLAVLERSFPKRSIAVYQIINGKKEAHCILSPEKLTGLGAPAIAPFGSGCIVSFPVEINDQWQIAYSILSAKTDQKGDFRLIKCMGNANISPAIAVIRNKACIVWESNAGEKRGIYACWVSQAKHEKVKRISSVGANSYNPSIVSIKNKALFAVWDSFRNNRSNIYGAWFKRGKWRKEKRITSDNRIERHPFLTTWKKEIWMAWQAQSYGPGEERWSDKDRAPIRLNHMNEQRIVVAKLTSRGLSMPIGLFSKVSTKKRLLKRPVIGFDHTGRLWLSARQSMKRQGGWFPVIWNYSGSTWSEKLVAVNRQGRWRPVHFAVFPKRIFAICQFDDLPDYWDKTMGKYRDWRSGVLVKRLRPALKKPKKLETKKLEIGAAPFSLAGQIKKCSASLPKQTAPYKDKKLTLFWGDLHDHTDLSVCARSYNPPGHDLFANVRDIEQLDFCALTDHGYNFDQPQWQFNAEQTRYNHDPYAFITFLGQEWTSSMPPKSGGYGHRNLIFLDPHFSRFFDAYDGDISPADIWKELEKEDFICIPHQLADWEHMEKFKGIGGNPPIDWHYTHEKLQPVAEIFQVRESYEHLGCPRQAKFSAPFQKYYLQDVWAKKTIIGVIAGPDHGGGFGKAGVWAEKLTRKSIFNAIRARHTFGTSGAKIGLLFRSGEAIMGDKVIPDGNPITFEVKAHAMRKIKDLVIFRNNKIVHRVKPKKKVLSLTWTDTKPLKEDFVWYYARVHCMDDELAWSSPIWFIKKE